MPANRADRTACATRSSCSAPTGSTTAGGRPRTPTAAAVVHLLPERHTPLGICPTSNVTLGVFPSLAQHPIDRLRRAGVPVSINTDDPALLGVRLEDEYAGCAAAFGWSADDVRGIA